MVTRIGFQGYGEAARAFRETLGGHNAGLVFTAYDILLDTEGAEGACVASMREDGVTIAPDLNALVSDSELIFCAVTAASSQAAVEAIAPLMRPGQILAEINSVAPVRKARNAALVEKRDARYIDMAVMAPVHPRGHRTPVLLAGHGIAVFVPELRALDFDLGVAGEEPGAATAIKMVRSLFVKGLEALTVETLLAAEESGCLDSILPSISGSYPGLEWPEFAKYQFERTTRHGKRRAEEMEECASTLGALNRADDLARAIAGVQRRMAAGDDAEAIERVRARLAVPLSGRKASG